MKVTEWGFDLKWRYVLPRYQCIFGAGHREGKYETYLVSCLGFYIFIERELYE